MTSYALVPLVGVVGYVTLLYIALRHPRRRERRAFALYLTAAGIWSLVSFLLHLDFSFLLPHTLPLTRLLLVIYIWMVVTYYYFVRVFVFRPPGLGLYAGVSGILLMASLAGAGLLPRDAYNVDGILFINYGVTFYAFAALNISLGLASVILLVQRQNQLTTPMARTQVSYLLLGLGIVFGASLTNLNQGLSRYPFDQLGNLANAAVISYAIMRYRLLDIRFVIRRSVAYFGLTTVVTTVYLLAIYLVQRFLPASLADYPELFVAIGVALMTAALFSPLRILAQERTDKLFFRDIYNYRRVLQDFSRGMVNTLDLKELAQTILEPLQKSLQARWTALLLPQPETGDYSAAQFYRSQNLQDEPVNLILRKDNPLVVWLAREHQVLRMEMLDVIPEGKALWESEREALESRETELLCPIGSRGELVGILALGQRGSGRPYKDDEIEVLVTISNGAAVALDNARILAALMHQQTRNEKLLAGVVKAQEEERQRVAADLHDSVAQWLVRASYQAQICSALLENHGDKRVSKELDEIEKIVDTCIVELRRVLAALRPPALEELGLVHAVRQELQSLRRDSMNCSLEIVGDEERLLPTAEITAYRIVQEALNNIRKHSQASQIQVRLHFRGKELAIEIVDNGRGFDLHHTLESAASVGHLGLLGMRERAAQVGGTLKMESRPGAGTRLELRLPIAAPEHIAEEVTWGPST